MKPIPTFILEHWIHKSTETVMFQLFIRGGMLFGMELPTNKDTIIYRYDLATNKWIKV